MLYTHKTTILCQFGSFLAQVYQPVSPSILNHFWWELYHRKWMLSTQILIVIKQSTYMELNEHSLGGNECEELTHSQQQPQGPKTHKKKPTIRQAIRTLFCTHQMSLLYRFFVSVEVKCKTHTQQSTSSRETA